MLRAEVSSESPNNIVCFPTKIPNYFAEGQRHVASTTTTTTTSRASYPSTESNVTHPPSRIPGRVVHNAAP